MDKDETKCSYRPTPLTYVRVTYETLLPLPDCCAIDNNILLCPGRKRKYKKSEKLFHVFVFQVLRAAYNYFLVKMLDLVDTVSKGHF